MQYITIKKSSNGVQSVYFISQQCADCPSHDRLGSETSQTEFFDSYDFAKLHTNILHDALKNNGRRLVQEELKVRGTRYFVIDKHTIAHWSQEPSTTTTCTSIDKKNLIEWTEYLIDNIYVKIGNKVLHPLTPQEPLWL